MANRRIYNTPLPIIQIKSVYSQIGFIQLQLFAAIHLSDHHYNTLVFCDDCIYLVVFSFVKLLDITLVLRVTCLQKRSCEQTFPLF